MALVLAACVDAGESGLRPLPPAASQANPDWERATLAASFTGQGSDALTRLLHDSIIVQPPSPDSALQGADAIHYITQLAAHTRASQSMLTPNAASPEGPFLFEQGRWDLRLATRAVRARYSLRWRITPTGWKVVLWRWSRFS
jgi:hypothetical protein